MKFIFITAGIILIGFLIYLHFIPIGIEPLTELYFENHANLPKNIEVGKKYSFVFTIHNLEYRDMNYTYNVSAFDNEGNLIFELDKGDIFLKNNESKTFYKDFKFNKPFDRAKINVKIVKNEMGEPLFKKKLWWEDPNKIDEINIHFWVKEK